MKHIYANPTAEIIMLANEDVLTISNPIEKGTPDSFNWNDLNDVSL